MGSIDWKCCLCNKVFRDSINQCPHCAHWGSPLHVHSSMAQGFKNWVSDTIYLYKIIVEHSVRDVISRLKRLKF